MSRAPPFPPARRSQTPTSSQYDDAPSSPNTTRPLQISRSRPTTPSSRNIPLPGPSSPPPGVPIRPARSGLRNRPVHEASGLERQSMDSLDGDYRDSVGTTHSDVSQPPPRHPRHNLSTSPPNGSIQTDLLTPISPSSEQELSPGGAAVLAAFQQAFARRRGMTEQDMADAEYEREKEKEMAIQRDRQRRLKEKVPGMRAHKPRAGDIDGAHCATVTLNAILSTSYL